MIHIIAAARSEVAKMCRRRSVWVLLGLFGIFSFGTAFATAAAGTGYDHQGSSPGLEAVLIGASVAPYVGAFLGAFTVTSEFSSGVSQYFYSWVPMRWPLLLGKAIGSALFAVILVGISVLFGVIPVAVYRLLAGIVTIRSGLIFLGLMVATILLALLGVGVGAVFKNSSAASLFLIFLLLLVPIAMGIVSRSWESIGILQELLPMANANKLFSFDEIENNESYFSPGYAICILAVWATGGVSLGAWRLLKDDI